MKRALEQAALGARQAGAVSSTHEPPEDEMPAPYTHINLAEVDDAAPGNDFGSYWEARVAREALDAEQTGVTHFRLRPGKRSPFAHRHAHAEEVYVILGGSGQIKLDDQCFDVRPLDAIRVAPVTVRAFEAGPEGLEFLAVGPHHGSDGELVDDPWIA
jgi:mannose-6-phosphate isomerase-like protein (cupin superfamily)